MTEKLPLKLFPVNLSAWIKVGIPTFIDALKFTGKSLRDLPFRDKTIEKVRFFKGSKRPKERLRTERPRDTTQV